MTKILPITKARQDLPLLVQNAGTLLSEYIITVNGYPLATIVPFSAYESWKETNEILADEKLMKSIKKAEEELDKGMGLNWEDVKKQLGINV